MSAKLRALKGELAAYSPLELSCFAETVSVLLKAADDGTLDYCVAHARIESTLAKAVRARTKADRVAKRTAEIIPFRFQ